MASVISGKSSSGFIAEGLREAAAEFADFLGMAIPHRDHAAGRPALGPGDQHDPAGEKPGGQLPRLAIIETIVGPGGGWTSEDLGGVAKIDAAAFEDGRALGWIAGYPYRNNCTPNK
jgi:hypothetical protein